jgi:hypothetical protein
MSFREHFARLMSMALFLRPPKLRGVVEEIDRRFAECDPSESSIDLSGCMLDVDSIEWLCCRLAAAFPRLVELNLGDNLLDDRSVAIVAEYLPKLSSLNVRSNQLTTKGAQWISRRLVDAQPVRPLDAIRMALECWLRARGSGDKQTSSVIAPHMSGPRHRQKERDRSANGS